LRAQLTKYASTSRMLLRAVLIKEGGLFGALGSIGKGAFNLAKSFPKSTATLGITAAMGGPAAVGKYRQYKAGFDPQAQKVMMGQAPVPPGV
jgi:hypothetical protein